MRLARLQCNLSHDIDFAIVGMLTPQVLLSRKPCIMTDALQAGQCASVWNRMFSRGSRPRLYGFLMLDIDNIHFSNVSLYGIISPPSILH